MDAAERRKAPLGPGVMTMAGTRDVDDLATDLLDRASGQGRVVLGIAGPPGSGKSSLAAELLQALDRRAPGEAALLPMDGFHLDNAVLEPRGLLARKGAPETFDFDGYRAALGRVRSGGSVAVPVFDRQLDLARAGAVVIGPEHRVVVSEGNYLLLDRDPWREVAEMFDVTLFLSVSEQELHSRLVQRWRDHGLSEASAVARAEGNDLANARLITRWRRPSDYDWVQ